MTFSYGWLWDLQLANPQLDVYKEGGNLMTGFLNLVHGDDCEGKWVYGRKPAKVDPPKLFDFLDVKTLLFNLLRKSSKKMPVYKTREMKGNQFQSVIEVKGHVFLGQPAVGKKQAERNASEVALEWLTGVSISKQAPKEASKEGFLDFAEKLKKSTLFGPSNSTTGASDKVRRKKALKVRASS